MAGFQPKCVFSAKVKQKSTWKTLWVSLNDLFLFLVHFRVSFTNLTDPSRQVRVNIVDVVYENIGYTYLSFNFVSITTIQKSSPILTG